MGAREGRDRRRGAPAGRARRGHVPGELGMGAARRRRHDVARPTRARERGCDGPGRARRARRHRRHGDGDAQGQAPLRPRDHRQEGHRLLTMRPAGSSSLDAPVMAQLHDGEAVLVWRFAAPRLVVTSAPLGGGIGMRNWALNAQVPRDYVRTDIDDHLREIARATGCEGDGVGMLTAARVREWSSADDGDVRAFATVGVTAPTWAADADDAVSAYRPGTINVVAFVPCALDESALVNAVTTVTEAKSQALLEHGVPGTGTASDAVCIVCSTPADGIRERFAGPRSRVGAALARAVHGAVRRGLGPGER